jgi:hypothetical protein
MKKQLLTSIFVTLLVMNFSFVNAQDVINLSTTDNIKTILSAYTGTNVVLVIPAGYTNPQSNAIASTTTPVTYSWNSLDLSTLTNLTSNTKITFSGDGTNPTLTLKAITLPPALSKIAFKNLTITGIVPNANTPGNVIDPTLNYVFNESAAIPCVIDSIVFDNCKFSTFRSLIRFQSTSAVGSETQKVNSVIINNCIVSNFADYGVVYNSTTGGKFGPVKVTKSTFYGFGATVFMLQKNATSIDISDCTFDNVVGTSAKAVVDLLTLTVPVTLTNCILGKTALASGALTIKTAGTLNITNCYYTTDWTAATPTATAGITGSLTAYSGASTALFKSPTVLTGFPSGTQTITTGDYTIIDATFAGKNNCGDPRWYYDLGAGVNNPNSSKKIANVQNFDILGNKLSSDAKGLVLKKITYDDGTSASEKVYIKEK